MRKINSPKSNVFTGKLDVKRPFEVEVNSSGLMATSEFLIDFAHQHGCLWNPVEKGSKTKTVFAVGMECGQYNMPLPKVLAFARSIGCQVIQPSGGHIDLARAATDAAYRREILETFKAARMPLTSVSIHVDTYAAIAVLSNPKARMFTPSEINKPKKSNSEISQAHINKLALMIIGAAQFGIQALHLFWGEPDNLKDYGWDPRSPADVAAMRKRFTRLIKSLVDLAAKFGIMLCHEIHFGTVAMNAEDFIAVWEELGKPENFCIGMDPSHFWHGETWWQAMDKLRKVGVRVILAHAKNFVTFPGRPMLGHQADDRLAGISFTSLDNPHGGVSMWDYLGLLTMSGIVDFWFGLGLPVPVHVEAENPFFKINSVTVKGVKYLRSLTDGLELPEGHFTDAMRR